MSLRSRRVLALSLVALAGGVLSLAWFPVSYVPLDPFVLAVLAMGLVAWAAIAWPWNGRG